ncbi:MAG TPA: VWA domain-containing protein [Vicinamibacterales bacterium]|nr:VWA domain-containing protein [Vicinamibacterales bacterium]
MTRVSTSAVVLVLAVAAASVAAQQTPPKPQPTPPQQTFRGGVRAVPVYAAVTDGAGGFVTDLTKDDFEIKDNGKVQTITSFTTDLQPITTMIVLDGSGSMLSSFNAVTDGANAFIIRMLPDDRTRISSFADQIRLSPGYTNNRDSLLEFLRNQFNLRMGNETRLWDAVDQAVVDLGQQEGRRVVLVFSDGYDTTSMLGAGNVQSDAIQRDATIYAVAMWTGRGSASTRPSGSLERLAQETGGGFFELHETDEMNSTFTKIALELHQQYLLAFEPQALDGKVHKLEVRVRTPGAKVRARRSYLAENVK